MEECPCNNCKEYDYFIPECGICDEYKEWRLRTYGEEYEEN